MPRIVTILITLLLSFIKNRKSSKKMSVSVVIPAYNEAEVIGSVIRVVKRSSIVNEVIVINDGSTDKTAIIAEKEGAKVITHKTNLGKGSALKTGLKNSKGDIVTFIDADITNLTPKQVEKIIKPILGGNADITKAKFKRKLGRVTELTAKPLLNFFFPEVKFDQPLSGQFAAKRTFLNLIKFEEDYGVDIGIILDADARGMRIKEVDMGHIEHAHAPMQGLNKMANEVVRTIVDRAVEYGRVSMMDTVGKYIRMSILGLSLTSLGLFSIFFVNKIPAVIGIILLIIGLIIALFYTFKIIRRSFKIFSRSDNKIPVLKSFFHMHFPVLVSALILVAMIFSFLGATQINSNGISIEPVSSNLIWDQNSIQIDFRGPYEVDSALSKNEFNAIRVPINAMETLGIKEGDSLYMNNVKYDVNSTIAGEKNTIRMSEDARTYLGVNVGDFISDREIKNKFSKVYMEKQLSLSENFTNLKITEGVFLLSQDKMGRLVNIYFNNQKIATTSGVFSGDYYDIYINNAKYDTIYINKSQSKTSVNTIYWNKDIIKIEIKGQTLTNSKFSNSNNGRFVNIIL